MGLENEPRSGLITEPQSSGVFMDQISMCVPFRNDDGVFGIFFPSSASTIDSFAFLFAIFVTFEAFELSILARNWAIETIVWQLEPKLRGQIDFPGREGENSLI